MTIDVIVVDHKGFDCLEVIFYHPDKDMEHRIYLCKNLLSTKFNISQHEIEEKLAKKKEPYIRQKKIEEFDEEIATWDIRHDVMVAYINSRITIPAGLEEHQFIVDLRPNFGDLTNERNGVQVLDVILEQYPEGVQPLKTKQKRRLSMVEISSAMQMLALEQAAASQLTSMAVEHVHVSRYGKDGGGDKSLEALLNEKSPRLEPLDPAAIAKLGKKGNSFKAAQDLAIQLCSGTLPGQDPANKPRRRGSVVTAETFASRRRKTFDDASGAPVPTTASFSVATSISSSSAAVLPSAASTKLNMTKRQLKERQASGLLSTSTGPMALSEEGPVLDEDGKLVITTSTNTAAPSAGNAVTSSNNMSMKDNTNKESTKDTNKIAATNKSNSSSKETAGSIKTSFRRRSFDGVMSVNNNRPTTATNDANNKKEKHSLGRAAKQRRGSAKSSNKSSKLAAKFENLQEVSKVYDANGSGSLDDEGDGLSAPLSDLVIDNSITATNNAGNVSKSSPMTSMAICRLKSVEEEDGAIVVGSGGSDTNAHSSADEGSEKQSASSLPFQSVANANYAAETLSVLLTGATSADSLNTLEKYE